MALPYIDTPRTEIDGNATYLTNGLRSAARHNLSALDSVENSFQTPTKDLDVVQALEKNRQRRDASLRTPRVTTGASARSARTVLNDRRTLPNAAPPKGEFTPLMKSATKNNFLRKSTARRTSSMNTPGLPTLDESEMYTDSIRDSDDQATPLPQIASSSPQSTPLPGRNSAGGIVGDGQAMTLREQENVRDPCFF